jgi:hypothetical protein
MSPIGTAARRPRIVIIGAGFVARLLMARAKGKTLSAFRYRDFGSMATIGRKRAVAQLGAFKLSGFPTWLLWSLAHIYFLIGFRNRLAVATSWAWNYVTFQRGTRLITGICGSCIEDVAPVVMTAPPLAQDTGATRRFQPSRHNDMGRRESPQHALP